MGKPRDHPRVGGEKRTFLWSNFSFQGSSPRGRGKVPYGPFPLQPARITPAWAGKSQRIGRKTAGKGAHPRVGGEKARGRVRSSCAAGSPPRRRGKECRIFMDYLDEGITPAWAGKSLFSSVSEVSLRDHPRVGGEKSGAVGQMTDKQGSPPHGRGKVRLAPLIQLLVGIIPAWAGKRRGHASGPCKHGDHPRMGGEKATRPP